MSQYHPATIYLNRVLNILRQKTAWGVFDKNGEKDEIGTINLLSPDVVAEAAREIRTGKRVSLNWGLEKLHQPGFGRSNLQHKVVNWREKQGFDFYSYDDEIKINTQAGVLSKLRSHS